MLAALVAREGDLVDFARQLVATPSPNPPGDERQVAELARQAMSNLGYSRVRTLSLAETRPNVVGEVGTSTSGSTLILNGHIDTKPSGEESEWNTAPYDPTVRDGRLYGLGATDMKGAVAAMVYAGAALAEAGELEGVLKVVLTADEEAGSRYGARFLAGRADLGADAAIVGEPTGMESPWAYIAVASRGIASFRVSVEGTQMHSSLSDQVPSVNASVKLGQVLTRMAAGFRPSHIVRPGVSGTPTVNLGVTLAGGVYYGIYPGHAEFGIDVRTVAGMTHERLRSELEDFLDQLRAEDPELRVSAEPVPDLDWFPPSSIDPGHPVVTAAQGAAREVLGREVPLATMPAFTDGTHWQLAGLPCIPAFGPGSLLLAHRPNEYVSVDEVIEAARIYALAALRYLNR
ncbi:MAG: M20 family metallopeptidase [Actinomycetota bacterium]|nr:M20 family metallopeptidase [Actinomycetota bacterium]